MPYFITDKAEECEAWAVVKEDGELMACHTTKQSAIDQMVAISLSEGIEPGGTYTERKRNTYKLKGKRSEACQDCDGNCKVCDKEIRAEASELEVGDYVSWNSSGGRARGEIKEIVRDGEINVPDSDFTITGTPDDPAALIQVYRRVEGGWEDTDVYVGHKFSTLTKIDPLEEPDDEPEDDDMESRAVNLEPPAFMRAAARRGLKYYEEGFAGDGLVRRTVDEARAMARGNVTRDKWVRIAAWIARHMDNLDAPQNSDRSDPGYPGPGLVAHLLWGSGPSKRQAQRAMEYAQRVVDRLEAEDKRGNGMAQRETRNFEADFEVREQGDGMTFVGYAAKFNSRSENLGGFVETIMPGAFKRSLRSRNDVKLLVNHDAGRVLASTRAGTLRLTEDSVGLKVEADLPNTTDGRDMAELLRRGDLSSMSFGFSVIKDSWSQDGTERSLESVRLFETSIVAFPAYQATEASVRAYEQLATRTNVDADELADAILKLEGGEDLSDDEARLLKDVVEKLTPKAEKVEAEPEVEDGLNLELKRKQLELILKRV